MLRWRSIVYDAGTSAESYEWLTVNSCAPDELRILDEKVNVLEIPKPPTAQVRPYQPLYWNPVVESCPQ